ncbi:hypothetical protein APHAL10511_000828 [Amanita phalloides]|nr:hypothetical protein APHAL10511_000828 [Amanita phalloides]
MALPERPEPMNAIAHHSKVKVSITVADPTFVAGKYVSGKMEMECRADKGLGIGVMMIELFGIQELSSRDHSATSTFIHAQRLFQGPGLPPSNAVQAHAEPGDPPLPSHHYHARRGVSTFLFRLPLPVTCPSSVNVGGGLATVKYELRASASVYWRGEKRLVTERKVIDVVGGLDDVALAEYVNGAHSSSITVGENGKLWMQGRIIGGDVITAGESACLELQVKNRSTKKNTGLMLTLYRRLVLPSIPSVEKQPLQISDTLTNVAFRGPEYIIHPGVEGVANLVFDIPKTARGVRGDVYYDEGDDRPRETQSIFNVQCVASVKMSMGIGSKDLVLDIPVTIISPLALPDLPMVLPQQQAPRTSPVELFSYPIPAPYPSYALYPAPVSSSPPLALSSPLPMFAAYTNQNRVWLPPPPPESPFPHQYISSVNPLYQSMTPLPLPSHQNSPPARPASALAMSQSCYYAEPNISELPTTGAHPLLPLHPAAHHESWLAQQPDPKPQEGKGERASRVAHHLHMSSRHRSVSPQSHRFPLPQSSPGGAHSIIETTVQARAPPSLVLPSPRTELNDPLHVSAPAQVVLHAAISPLYSPQPVRSPEMSSASLESLPRSERVEELERMAAEAEDDLALHMVSKTERRGRSKNKGKQKQIVELMADINTTLSPPSVPPVPMHQGYGAGLSPPEARLSDYFSIERVESVEQMIKPDEIPPTPIPAPADKAPPTPTLTAITPVRYGRSSLTDTLGPENVESGLDALERRLLAEVGTQKIERIFSGSPNARDLFAGPSDVQVAYGAIASPVGEAEAEGSARPTKGRLSPIKITACRINGDTEDDGLNVDSAISSLTLADGGWAMEADRRAREVEQRHEPAPDEAHEDRDSDERTHRAGTVGSKSKSKSSFSGDDGREERKQRKKHKRQSGDLVVDTEPEDEAESRGRSREGSMRGKKSNKKKEGHKLRKAVKGRVTAWLGSIEPDAMPLEDPKSDLAPAAQRGGASTSSRAKDIQPEVAVADEGTARALPLHPVNAEQSDIPASAPNPRSSGFMPITPEKRETNRSRCHLSAASTKRPSNINHDLKQLFSPILSCALTPNINGDTSIPSSHTHLKAGKAAGTSVPSLVQRRSTSNPNGWEGKSKLGPVNVGLDDLSKVALTVAESRSALVLTNEPSMQPLNRVPSVPKQQSQDHDARSARGGKGGHVTAIAAFWAAAAQEASKAGASKWPKGPSADVPSRRQSAPIATPKPVMTQRVEKSLADSERRASLPQKTHVSAKSVDTNKASSSQVDSSPKLLGLAGKSRSAAKASSVPAVISSSLATPMLSSTASLARPPSQRARRSTTINNLMVPLDSIKPPGPMKAQSTPDLGFGKARLRDLIRKYQEQGS